MMNQHFTLMKMNSDNFYHPISDGMRDLIVRYMNAVNEKDHVKQEALLHAINQQRKRDLEES